MGRLFLLLLVALGVALYIPESRARILEAAAPMANPAYRWMSHQQMNQIVDDLEIHLGSGNRLPVARGEFSGWMNRRYRQARSRSDAWGTPYQLQAAGRETFRVLSAGPDLTFGTDDDLVREGSLTPNRSR